jgi:Fe-S-cluster formation regulator IscX/YfhJ
MGLRNPSGNAATAASSAPQFETDTDTLDATSLAGEEGVDFTPPSSEEEAAAATRRAAAAQAKADATAPAPAPTSTAVAPVVKKELSEIIGSKFQPALQEFKDVIDPASLEFDTFSRITVGLDGFSDDQEKDLGKVIKLRLMSWNKRYIVTAGEDDKTANELTRFSLDGITLDNDGSLAADWVKVLKETHGYKDAAIKEYYQLYGFLIATSESGNLVDVPEEDQIIVSIQCPPRSKAQFTNYQITMGVKVSKGILPASDEIVLTQAKEKGKTKSYAKILFSHK